MFESVSTTNFTSAASITITKPTGLAVGDLMIAFIASQANAPSSLTAPAGWGDVDSADLGAESWKSFYKVADSSDVAASDFTFNGDGEYIGGSITRLSGVSANFTNRSQVLIASSSSGTNTFTGSAITPSANNVILFFTYFQGSAPSVSNYACATSNPTWNEAYEIGNTAPTPDQNLSMAYATRTESTSTGNFSCNVTTAGGPLAGFFLALPPVVNVTVSPAVVTSTVTVQAPSVTGSATVTPTVISIPVAVQAPTVTTSANDWSNQTKNPSTWVNNTKN